MDLAAPELFATGTQPGQAPRVKLEARAPAGGLGGFGGDLLSSAAAATGFVPPQPDPLTDALSALSVQLLPAPGLATCRLRFLPRSDFPALSLGDPLTVKLSASSSEAPAPVFAGTVAQVAAGARGALDVLLASPAAKLARIRRNGGYENQNFAALLQGWSSEAGLTNGRIDKGPDYAFFAIDDRLSVWDWIARVARHAGVPAWADASGALNAHKPAGQPKARFRWGETVLSLDAHARDPVTTGARIVGEGSAGRQGSDAWAWLAKDPQGVSASAGAGGRSAPVEHEGGLRDLASVAAAAAGAAAGGSRIADVVDVRVPGTPSLDIASVFELSGCSGGQGDGLWSALEVQHDFSARGGFVTRLVGVPL